MGNSAHLERSKSKAQPAQTWNQLRNSRERFQRPHVVIYFDCETAEGEMRYHAIGYITEQLMAVVVYIDLSQNDDEHIHLLSARKAEAFEESIYADQFR